MAEDTGSKPYTVHDCNYFYDEDGDYYVTTGIKKRAVIVRGDVHRAMIEDYSDSDGEPLTINEMCAKYEVGRSFLVKYLKAHEMTHDREPYTAEEMLARNTEELVGDALQQRRSRFTRSYERAKLKRTISSATNWDNFAETTLAAIQAHVSKERPEPPELTLTPAERKYALVMGLTDFHWGQRAWAPETGESFDRIEAENRLWKATQGVLDRLPGQPDRIVVPIGSDFFHCDGYTATTTKGTPQDVDGSPTEILVTGIELLEDYVDLLRQIAPVDLVLMSGNHDRVNGLAALLTLTAIYRECEDVRIPLGYAPRTYLDYGECLLAFSHGDGVKLRDLPAVVATEAREQWGRCKHHVAFGGHFHHQKVTEIGGLVHYQMPSLAGTDRWHANHGYTTAQGGMNAYLVDKEQGVTGTLFSPSR